MFSYQLFGVDGNPVSVNWEGENGIKYSAPLTTQNRDCAQFLADWQAGATVTNDDGSPAPYSYAAARALGLL